MDMWIPRGRQLSFLFLFFFFHGETTEGQNNLVAPFSISRTASQIKVDGLLEEGEWNNVLPLSEFMQAAPVPGENAGCRTEVRMLYDDENIYVGVRAFDSTGKYVVSGLQRDKYYRSEDGVSLMFDTYNDKIHSLLFFSNTVGARFDEEVEDNGDGFNSAYNTFWDVKTQLFSGGYTMEFVIPFSSLRFQAKEEVVMGFKVVRQIGRMNEFDIFPSCEKNLGNMVWRVSTEAEIIFKDVRAKKPVYLIPYARADYAQISVLNDEQTKFQSSHEWMTRNNFVRNEATDRILSSVGLDAKIGLSKNFTLDATVNTDFAQAEADNRVFNFTRFNIFVPEKRQFFLESNNYLNFSVPGDFQLFNSRNIGIENGKIIPIAGGLRLTGKSAGWQLGALDIQTQGLRSADVAPENFGVIHLHKDLLGNGSYCSGFFSNRTTTGSDSISNQVLAFDYLQHINDKWLYGLNVGGSVDERQKTSIGDNSIWNALVLRQVSYGYSNLLTVTRAGKQFNPMSGFYFDNGFSMAYAYNGYTFQVKNSKRVNYLDLSTEIYYKWNTRNTADVESEYFNIIPSLSLKNGMLLKDKIYGYSRDYLPYGWAISGHVLIPPDRYNLAGNQFTFESQKNIRVLYQLVVTTDNFYGGSRWSLEPQLNGSLNKHFAVQLYYLLTQVKFPAEFSDNGDGTFQSQLMSARLLYSFTAQTSFSLLFQYDDISKTAGANFRFRYNPVEGTDLFVVYNPNVNTDLSRFAPELPRVAQQVLIVKFTKTFHVKAGGKQK